MKKRVNILVVLCIMLFSCSCNSIRTNSKLPPSQADPNSMFGIDLNINQETIDNYLGRNDVEYIDIRMLFDSANFGDIGGDADLSRSIKGFKIVPFPFLADLPELPVSGAYDGPCLYSVEWDNGSIMSANPNYIESELILNEVFPKDKAIFLMCGGGGYSGMMKSLLVYLGWNEEFIYNTGGNWNYKGQNSVELIVFPEDVNDDKIYATWRADYTYIDFERLHEIKK